jgi:hypothetical protein
VKDCVGGCGAGNFNSRDGGWCYAKIERLVGRIYNKAMRDDRAR